MVKFISMLLTLASFCTGVIAQEYRLVMAGPFMPDMNTPVAVIAEQNNGNGFIAIPVKRYILESAEASPVAGAKGSNFFRFNRTAVYANKGRANFTLRTAGKTIPLALDLPILRDMRFNLYTDSIKPILNFYVNIDGTFTNGRVFPLDTNLVTISASEGAMDGMEWVLPKTRNFEKVTFTAVGKYDASLIRTITVYLKKYKDPRDDMNYQDRTEDEVKRGINRR